MSDPPPPQRLPGATPLLQAVGISKQYGTFLANDGVDLDLRPHEIHALLGENGAGKSTLVKVIYGLIQPSAGELRWRGETIALAGPAAARALGIGMVFQHFSLFENLTIAENVALGLHADESVAALSARLAAVSRDYGLPLDPRREVWRLSVGERQRIEIVRALMQEPQLLILDEPTAVLTPQEADQLFVTLRRLRDEGRAILYISHKLDEVQRLCDTATILRAGKKVARCDPRQETAGSLARMMVGADIHAVKPAHGTVGPPRLTVRDLSLPPDDPHGVALRGISFTLNGGEILGIAGVAGNGQDELFSALSGERIVADAGVVAIEGRAAGRLPATQRRRLGAAFVPEERLGRATAPRMTLSENALLTGHATSGDMVRHGFIDKQATLDAVDRIAARFGVHKAERDPEAASLSGGNLQKFVVGREILREPGVLVVSQPTRGVDASAAAVIRQALIDLAARGAAVLVISHDLDEIEEIADRIAVMFAGTLSAPLPRAGIDRERIGLLMGGSGTAARQEVIHAAGA